MRIGLSHPKIHQTFKIIYMSKIMLALSIWFLLSGSVACKSNKSAAKPCPSDGKNVGAERFFSGEKLPKAKKFKG
jgi:hypothetical protein